MTLVQAVKGSITKFPSTAIVNAANSSLLGGGGVDGAIHKAAGKDLLFACRLLNGCKTGEAKITKAFNIKTAEYIIHTVGPYYKGLPVEDSERLLASCYTKSLNLAKDFDSIVFPAISTGIYGYPLEDATNVAVAAIKSWLEVNPDTKLKTVILISLTDEDYDRIRKIVEKSF